MLLSELLFVDLTVLLLLLRVLCCWLTVALLLLFSALLRVDLTVVPLLFSEELRCGLTVVVLRLLRLLFELSTVPALLVASLLRVVGVTFSTLPSPVAVLPVVDLVVADLSTLPVPVADLLVVDLVLVVLSTLPLPVADLLLVALLSNASGRNTLTVLLFTRVDLPERLLELSSRCTVAFLPVVRS